MLYVVTYNVHNVLKCTKSQLITKTVDLKMYKCTKIALSAKNLCRIVLMFNFCFDFMSYVSSCYLPLSRQASTVVSLCML